jgi:hypothetical protein
MRVVSKERKHHYIPIFYLSRWASPSDHRLAYFKRERGKLIADRISPKNTGYERGLNSLAATQEVTKREVLEDKIFSGVIDSHAAPAIAKLVERKGRGIDATTGLHIVHFLLSLRVRHPDSIAFFRGKGTQIFMDELAKDPEEYDRLKGSSSKARQIHRRSPST